MKTSLLILISCLAFLPETALSQSNTGKKLFESTRLGTNGKSCQSCHNKGTGLEELSEYDTETLQGLVNICIEDALKGKSFPEDAAELSELANYIRKFSTK